MYKIICNSPFFKGLSVDETKKCLSEVEHFNRTFRKNSLVTPRGNDCNSLLFVISGCVRCEMTDYTGKKIEIEKIRSPRLIAPAFLFGKNNRFPVDVICTEKTDILFIPKNSLLILMQKSAIVLKNYLDTISSKTQFLAQRLRFISFKSIKQKLAHYILHFAGKDKTKIMLPRNQTQLSEFFGVSRPSLARVFIQMKNEGLIEYKGRNVTILEKDMLVEILKD